MAHAAEVSDGLWVGITEITEHQWSMVMDPPHSRGSGGDRPAGFVDWFAARRFCRRLSKMDGLEYRLPTETEWEYCCRAGTTTRYAFGDTLGQSQANILVVDGINIGQTTKVKSYQPNAWGLYDMHGNVREWCQNRMDEDYYTCWGRTKGSSSNWRAIRGGDFKSVAVSAESGRRIAADPSWEPEQYGLRIVLQQGKREHDEVGTATDN